MLFLLIFIHDLTNTSENVNVNESLNLIDEKKRNVDNGKKKGGGEL